MQVSILNLRSRVKEILQALERSEMVEVFYNGKHKGTIISHIVPTKLTTQDHPYFDMTASSKKPVIKKLKELRRSSFV